MTNLIRAENLSLTFGMSAGFWKRPRRLQAVNQVSLNIPQGKIVGLVGESGCGKSTLGRLIMGILHPDEGQVFFNDKPIHQLKGEARRCLRQHMQMVFQDPYGSLNPRISIRDAVAEPLIAHRPKLSRSDREELVRIMLEHVRLENVDPLSLPGNMSGGQRQRVAIARALVAEPEFVFADEPVSALDVSVQAQILNLLTKLRGPKLTMLFVSHDLRVVEHISDVVVVMYLGRIVERADARTLFKNPRHPYTLALMSAVPGLHEPGRDRILLEGDPPSLDNPPSGCAFHPRCPVLSKLSAAQQAYCIQTAPVPDENAEHVVRCHFPLE